jgi:uncharacterized protein (DUF885 family)
LVDDIFAALWTLDPAWAVYLGRHEYDGMVPDWSTDSVDGRLGEVDRLVSQLQALEGLDDDQAFDRELLVAQVDKTSFDWRVLRTVQRNPMPWVYLLDPDLYMKRNYAPAADRADVVVRLLGSADAVLDLARERLDPVLARTIVEWGITAARGLATMIVEEVPVLFAVSRSLDQGPGIAAVSHRAAAALRTFADWLETERLPQADDGFAIGGENLEELLRVSEMIEMSLGDMLTMAYADLESNLAAFVASAAELDPDASPRQVYERHVASVHAGRGELVSATELMLEEIRSFVIDHDVITVPSEVRALVAETPRHLRWAFAMMDTPGPYEKESTEAYYYVTPTEPEWDDAKAEEWLRALNTFALEDISIHEAYPGHYVHFLHYDSAPTEVSRRLTSYAFTEGWAHYAEEMMWEAGYRAGDTRFRLAQLSEALVRDCRFVCAIRLHAQGMTVDEATDFFIENAFYSEVPARREAERGTFDPGYFSYTIGKLQILRLRDDYRTSAGPDFTLKGFHDRLLSRGAPPVAMMRKVMLP